MRAIPFFAILAGLVITDYSSAQATKEPFPVPPPSTVRLFYIQRSNNANTVIYDANLVENQKFDPEKPVNVYWIRYAEQGQSERLSMLQWRLAYGYSHQPVHRPAEGYTINLNAFEKRPIKIIYEAGRPAAMIQINGRHARLQKVFVQLAPGNRLIPHVLYIDIFGVDPEKDLPVFERIHV